MSDRPTPLLAILIPSLPAPDPALPVERVPSVRVLKNPDTQVVRSLVTTSIGLSYTESSMGSTTNIVPRAVSEIRLSDPSSLG